MRTHWLIFVLLAGALSACRGDQSDASGRDAVLRVAVTTSTRDSGLLERLVPLFESAHKVRVDIIAVGTGKALKLGEAGDVDVVFVHSRAAEDAFMAAGHGVRREDVMYNSFEILGPNSDPAGVAGMSAPAALQKLAAEGHRFVSRGDDSGTHKREQKLWKQGGGRPSWAEYVESGQGMGASLIMADQMAAYVLADRGTYLNFKQKIELVPVVAGSDELKNPYGILVVDPSKHPAIRGDLAQAFVDFFISAPTQRLIQQYTVGGEQLFYPLRLPAGQ